jgi:hypothetical protein
MITTTANRLQVGDLVTAGHGYGERPARVVAVGAFSSSVVVAELDGRAVSFDVDAPVSVEDDYEVLRDLR